MGQEDLKDAFFRVKQDISILVSELSGLKSELLELKSELSLFSSFFHEISDLRLLERITSLEYQVNALSTSFLAFPTPTPTHPKEIPTHPAYPTDTPTLPQETMGLLRPIASISTGNRGVPTDRQTDQQTDQHLPIVDKSDSPALEKASEILSNLDQLKKEVRFKFKTLTPQEVQVFSLIYSLENQGNIVDYPLLASTLQLSESSVRDYILKIQRKGIPISKEKINNKRILLHISPELRKIASLDTLLKLREL